MLVESLFMASSFLLLYTCMQLTNNDDDYTLLYGKKNEAKILDINQKMEQLDINIFDL